MQKPKRKSKQRKKIIDFPWANLLWGGLALCVWLGEQAWHVQKGEAFSLLLLLKGLLILALAALVYHFSAFKGFSFLGLFPLLWLAVSRFQWDLCAVADNHYWIWLALFLSAEILIFKVSDGKWILAVLAPLWTALGWLFPFSFLLPLTFLTAQKGRFKRSEWVKWGGLGLGFFLFIFLRGWRSFNWFEEPSGGVPIRYGLYFWALWFFFITVPLFFLRRFRSPITRTVSFSMLFNLSFFGPFLLGLMWWLSNHFYFGGIYNLLIHQWYLAFLLLGWLGLIAMPKKGTFRFGVFPLFLLTVGLLFWGAFPPLSMEMTLFQWVLVFFTGFGFESFRRDLMDPTWHGRLVWVGFGIAIFTGVI